MASETSSAVLELTDADAEDTEAQSVSDDHHEGPPLIMEHGYDIAVKVDAPMKQLSTLETFVTYRVRCVCARWTSPPNGARRRYNHFKALHKRLSQSHPLLAVPPLPPLHSARQQLDRYSPSFVAIRTVALNLFLERVAKHPIFTHSEDFRLFLVTPDEELDKVFKSENSALNLWGLSSALYGGTSDSRPTNGARVRDPEFTSAADYLQSLQQKLITLCSLTTKLYKGSAALSDELMGMKRACDAWSTQAGGRTARAAAATALGAATHSHALARHRAPLRHRAALPLLAAYAHAHTEKIRQRDAIHAAHVSGNNTGELHNRLEQASEALRSELTDWIPKTHSEIKSLLLDMAEKQVSTFTHTVMGWENALKLSTEQNIEEIFKTVSKNAVQNLSPSKCKLELTPTETDKDFDDIYSNDSDFEIDKKDSILSLNDGVDIVSNVSVVGVDVNKCLNFESNNEDFESLNVLSDDSKVDVILSNVESNESVLDSNGSSEQNGSKLDEVGSDLGTDLEQLKLNAEINETNEDVGSEVKKDGSKEDVILDPLQSFSVVDLSS